MMVRCSGSECLQFADLLNTSMEGGFLSYFADIALVHDEVIQHHIEMHLIRVVLAGHVGALTLDVGGSMGRLGWLV